MAPQTTTQTETPTPAPTPAPAASTQPAAPAIDPVMVETIFHDIFVLGLAAAAFFIKNPGTAQRAGQVVNILSGLQVAPVPPLLGN